MIIGRRKELKQLERIYKSKEAEFITIYGRRRVGKTYLIREFFKTKDCVYFEATGKHKASMRAQLEKFSRDLSRTFYDNDPLAVPDNWDLALGLLHKNIIKTEKKVVVFLDELPWMATRKSNLMKELEHYWNHYWSALPHVILVVCGSSASWLIKKVIYNKGGLHNRTTLKMRLLPFSLLETKEYLKSKGVDLNNKHITDIYMALGGVPYYLKQIEPGLTAIQNIQRLIFDTNAQLRDEFTILFESLYDGADAYIELMSLIAQKREGMERAELKAAVKLTTEGGSLTKRLGDLIEAGFIESFIPWGRTRGQFYKIIDEFSLFHLYWIKPAKDKRLEKDYWINETMRPSFFSWAGYAFEAVCMKHINQIISALGIKKVHSIGSWRFIPTNIKEHGGQIDLIIDRFDNAITLCEIKHTEQPFSIDKKYASHLITLIELFKHETKTTKQVFLAFISASGIKETMYSEELVAGVATLSDLFKESE